MTEEHTCCGGGCGTEAATDEAQVDASCCGGSTAQKCDVDLGISEDAKFATLLMLVPMLTLSAFNMMGLL